MITKQDLEDYRFKEISPEQQFAKLKIWQNKLTRLRTAYGSVRASDLPGYHTVSRQLREIMENTLSDTERLSRKYREADCLINQISDSKIKAVMYQYYVLCAADRDEVAAILGLPKRTVYRLHGYGTEIIRKLKKFAQKFLVPFAEILRIDKVFAAAYHRA